MAARKLCFCVLAFPSSPALAHQHGWRAGSLPAHSLPATMLSPARPMLMSPHPSVPVVSGLGDKHVAHPTGEQQPLVYAYLPALLQGFGAFYFAGMPCGPTADLHFFPTLSPFLVPLTLGQVWWLWHFLPCGMPSWDSWTVGMD